MIEKFSDYEGGYIEQEGEFVFTIKDYELKEAKTVGNDPVATFTVNCIAGNTIIRHSLSRKARWSYNKLIKAALKLNTPEKIADYELDYEVIGNELVGKQFIAKVIKDAYDAEVKTLLDDGTYETSIETKVSYKIDTSSYREYEGEE